MLFLELQPQRSFRKRPWAQFVFVAPSVIGIVMTSGYRRPNCNRQRVRLELEALEARDLPSVSALNPSVSGNQSALTVVLDIRGTQLTYDTRGLPASLSGNIYIGTQPSGPVVGQYTENLTPLLIDGMFIGTLGQATFSFLPGSSNEPPVATIHTFDVSLIQGIVPTIGALNVNSTGTITDVSGIIAGVQGGFTSSSFLIFGPPFASNTQVEFSIQ